MDSIVHDVLWEMHLATFHFFPLVWILLLLGPLMLSKTLYHRPILSLWRTGNLIWYSRVFQKLPVVNLALYAHVLYSWGVLWSPRRCKWFLTSYPGHINGFFEGIISLKFQFVDVNFANSTIREICNSRKKPLLCFNHLLWSAP